MALRRGAGEAARCRGLILALWGVGAAGGLACAAAWTGSWAEALRHTGAGHDLARGFDFTLLGDLLRRAGPGLGELRGWAWGVGAAYLALIAVLQGGALTLLAAPRARRSAALFGEGCGRLAPAMLGFAALSLLSALLCGGLGLALVGAAEAVARDSVGSAAASALRLVAWVGAGLLFAFFQAVLELARLERASSLQGGWLVALPAAARFACLRPLACLSLYGAACAVSLAALAPAVALARAAGLLPAGWGCGMWVAAQVWLLARWASRVGLWAGLGVLYGALGWRAD